ncbi:maleylpyruvate isomerase family mycothiol-dependent enzyme [Nocardiopsis sp. B62]|uniref:maleylpyruvate isomerase family mycothiol-dependent enzyme n=1 Tax=Nocardiopsis sp. B62 TaxID=2824874 RepID=UPI001B37E73D|nr:maleylpyruvate isomerase family mycothiol-dependent enzyme [Nocardiopsis sp. B62]MBQ1084468.1 maleylpyruvate isomerase family mycothiol-dependent enzyme [Nocardiopsis sp. B62]
METTDPRRMLAVEHAALVADLRELTDEQWNQTSLCTEWNVHEVVAHLGSGMTIGQLGWIVSILRSGLRPAVHNRRQMARFARHEPAATLARFAALGTEGGEPVRLPSGDPSPWLGELVVHGQDVRRPLGIEREPTPEAVAEVARYLASRDFAVNSRTQVKGLHLRATDSDFTTNDPGLPVVEGPLLALVMLMAGRPAYLDQASGTGLPELRSRLEA